MNARREISGSTTVVAVVGHPVSHSLSPTIHNAAFAASGLDWVMVPMPVAPHDGSAIVAAIRTLGLAGAAVTMPHKQAVAGSVDILDPAAGALDSVNTIVMQDDARTVGYSTDGAGFVASLLASGTGLDGCRVVVVGAGAAARSVIDALGRTGCSSIQVMNRTPEAAQIAAGLAPMASVVDIVEARDCLSGADVIVNATSVGMGSDESPVAAGVLHSDHTVVDLVYHPRETALLREARRVGAAAIDGVGMLVHQAALQHRLWTGATPDLDVMWDAANAALQQRR
jgi:shikimate dehydrogenase